MSYYQNKRVGEQLGNYRLIRLLGEGGFAEVYLAEHMFLNTFAAIKLLKVRLTNQHIERFLQEARTLARLKHPRIIRILDFGVAEDTYIPFLVMDYAPNGTLRQRCPTGTRVPLNLIVNYVQQVAEALQYAHDQQLIHRDVKPENMFLDQNGNVLLGDFGITTIVSNDDSGNLATQESAVGTVVYMAPEQIEKKPRRASDQYALGIVVYEWLTGDCPFHGDALQIMYQHLYVRPSLLREKVSEIPIAVEQVVMKALSKDPDDRYSTVMDFARALGQAAQAVSLPPSSKRSIVLPIPSKQEQSGGEISVPAVIDDQPSIIAAQKFCPFCGSQTQIQDAICANCGELLIVDNNFRAIEGLPPGISPNNQQGTLGTRFVPKSNAKQDPWSISLEQSIVEPWQTVQGSKAEPTLIAPPEKSEVFLPTFSPTYREVKKNTIAQLMQEGEQSYRAKRFEEALATFTRIITLDPQNVSAHSYKGNALGKLRRYKEALAAYEAALNIDPQHPSIWSAKGDILVKLKRSEEALSAYEKALSLSPQDAPTWFAKGNVLARLRRYEKAVDAYKEYLTISPQDASVWVTKGNTLAKLRQHEEALIDYDNALKCNAQCGAAWEAKGKLLSELQKYEESFEAFTKAAQLLPKKAEVWVARSDVLFNLNHYDEALVDCERAHHLKPEDRDIKEKCDRLRVLKQHKEELAQAQSQVKQKKPDTTPPFASPGTRVFSPGTSRVDQPDDQVASRNSSKQTKSPDHHLDGKANSKHFDIFLSYGSEDVRLVKELAEHLEDQQGFRVWFGEWMKIPGLSHQQAIAKGLQQSHCYAVCIGASDLDGWLKREMEWANTKQAEDASFRVIPVLLSNAPQGIENEIDEFLKQNTLVDFREGDLALAFHKLVCGVEGVPIGRWPPRNTAFTQTSSIAETKLRELHYFEEDHLVDKSVSIEFQRIVLTQHWLGIDDTEGKRQ